MDLGRDMFDIQRRAKGFIQAKKKKKSTTFKCKTQISRRGANNQEYNLQERHIFASLLKKKRKPSQVPPKNSKIAKIQDS